MKWNSSGYLPFIHDRRDRMLTKVPQKSSWTWGKGLFILNRYYALISVIINTYGINHVLRFCGPVVDMSPCLNFFRWQGWTGLIACMIAEVILQMRLYAMYSLDKKVLALMGSCFIASSTASAVIMGSVLSKITAGAVPLTPDLIFCVPQHVSKHFFAFWIPMLAFESLLCFLALYKGYETFKTSSSAFRSGRHLVSILIRDSVLYFLVMFATYLTNLLVFLIAPQNLLEIPIGFSVALSCVMGNRISLNVRDVNRELEQARLSGKMGGQSQGLDSGGSRSKILPVGETSLTGIEMAQLRSMRATTHSRVAGQYLVDWQLLVCDVYEMRDIGAMPADRRACALIPIAVRADITMPDETSPLLNGNLDSSTFYDASVEGLEASKPEPSPKSYIALLTPMALGIFLTATDATIVVSSYAAIGNEMNQLQNTSWIATAYMLTTTSFQPLYGKLSDIFGRKGCLLFAYSVFALGCLGCGLARNMEELILFRALAGVGGGGMQTIVSIIVSDVVPLRSRGTWQGVLNIIWTMGSASGAPLGGFFADNIGWRWAFLLQVPLTILAIISVSFGLHLPKSDSSDFSAKLKRVDFAGSFALIITVFSLLFGLDRGGNISWNDTLTLASFGSFVVFLILFGIIETRLASEPFAPKRIIFNRSLIAGYLVNFFGIASGMSLIFHVSLYLQAVQGNTASEAGLWLVLSVFGGLMGSLSGGLMIQTTGKFYLLTVAGYGLHFLGTAFVSFTTRVTLGSMVPFGLGLLVSSFGNGSGITTSLIALIANAGPEDQAIATAVSYLFRSLGSVVGVSVGSTVVQETLRTYLRRNLSGENVEEIILRVRESLDYIDQLEPSTQLIVKAAYSQAVQATFTFTVAMSSLAFISSLFIKETALTRR
ncbi:hypothetical protein DXG01_013796 [Tephrocybe rancida]|nr:hypothetical protein DXG01_013796 [Tephrocybe rancida]